ncbi:hypothetical protein ANN_26260 [Periplaneta americana]|uniref:Uncharacterized protein n=1 Tax=Periplaneta americana TaxID=6978 RepID=A0ABQ8S5V5_PERAM|nr:hypothetical protein ANN_26260 [Periplaneta americana]
MAGLCEGGNEPSGSLKAIYQEQKLQGCSKSLLELQAIKDKLERNLHETEQQLQQEKTNSEHYRNELVQSLEAEIAEMRRKELSSTNTEKQEQEWKLKLKDLKTKYLGMVQNLEQENTELKEELKNMQARLEETTTTSATPSVLTEVKKVMNLVYHTLQPQFTPETLYDGSKIRQMLMATIRKEKRDTDTMIREFLVGRAVRGEPKNSGGICKRGLREL